MGMPISMISVAHMELLSIKIRYMFQVNGLASHMFALIISVMFEALDESI